jgi:hypothetical protein
MIFMTSSRIAPEPTAQQGSRSSLQRAIRRYFERLVESAAADDIPPVFLVGPPGHFQGGFARHNDDALLLTTTAVGIYYDLRAGTSTAKK